MNDTVLVISDEGTARSVADLLPGCTVVDVHGAEFIQKYDTALVLIDDRACHGYADVLEQEKANLFKTGFRVVLIDNIMRDFPCEFEFVDDVIDTPSAHMKQMLLAQLQIYRQQCKNLSAIKLLIYLAQAKDDVTGEHMKRTREYVRILAAHLFDQGRIGAADVRAYYEAAPLHDIGKIGIPDSILAAPRALDHEERMVMNGHATLGHVALDIACKHDPSLSFAVARDIALTHHERWDGSGYPHGLAGEDIPLAGRVMAIADCFDVASHDRPYKRGKPFEEAFDDIVSGGGKAFDPSLIEITRDAKELFRAIDNSQENV